MAPSSPDHPTVLNALTDENENWSMSVCAQVLNLYRDLLLSNSLQVNGIKSYISTDSFSGPAEMASGSVSRSLGHAGQACDYHCNRCLVNSDQTHLAAEPRTTEVHNSLAVYTAIMPGRLVGEGSSTICARGARPSRSRPWTLGWLATMSSTWISTCPRCLSSFVRAS